MRVKWPSKKRCIKKCAREEKMSKSTTTTWLLKVLTWTKKIWKVTISIITRITKISTIIHFATNSIKCETSTSRKENQGFFHKKPVSGLFESNDFNY